MQQSIPGKLFVFFVSFFVFTGTLCAETAQSLETYQFDPSHTYVIWRVSHFGFSDLSGKFMADGTVQFDQAKPQNSKVNVTIHTADMVTAIPKLDDVLKGNNFFAVNKYPVASFVSTHIQITGKNTAKVSGVLTIRGIAKPVTLNVRLNQSGVHPYYHKKAMGFHAEATVKRSDYDMTGYLPGVGDEVALDIEAEAEVVK